MSFWSCFYSGVCCIKFARKTVSCNMCRRKAKPPRIINTQTWVTHHVTAYAWYSQGCLKLFYFSIFTIHNSFNELVDFALHLNTNVFHNVFWTPCFMPARVKYKFQICKWGNNCTRARRLRFNSLGCLGSSVLCTVLCGTVMDQKLQCYSTVLYC